MVIVGTEKNIDLAITINLSKNKFVAWSKHKYHSYNAQFLRSGCRTFLRGGGGGEFENAAVAVFCVLTY